MSDNVLELRLAQRKRVNEEIKHRRKLLTTAMSNSTEEKQLLNEIEQLTYIGLSLQQHTDYIKEINKISNAMRDL